MTGLDVEAARNVLLDSLPADPKWAVWVNGVVERLGLVRPVEGVVLTLEEAGLAAPALRHAAAHHAAASGAAWHVLAADLKALAARLEAAQ